MQRLPAGSNANPSGSQPAPPCGRSDINCQVYVLERWRAQMADVVRPTSIPKSYFDGVGHGSEPIYETPSFWDGRGGALGFNLFSRTGRDRDLRPGREHYDIAVRAAT